MQRAEACGSGRSWTYEARSDRFEGGHALRVEAHAHVGVHSAGNCRHFVSDVVRRFSWELDAEHTLVGLHPGATAPGAVARVALEGRPVVSAATAPQDAQRLPVRIHAQDGDLFDRERFSFRTEDTQPKRWNTP